MTGMGTFLATVALAVPLITWLRGTFFFVAPPYELAHALRPRENNSTPWNSNSPTARTRPGRMR